MKKHILSASLVLTTLTSFGAGYQVNLEGLRQMAMGGAGTAWPWDASTIFYNPGGLARLKNLQVYGSIADIMPATAYGNVQGSTTTQSQSFTPFNIYFGGTVKEGSRLALGLGIYTPFGTGLTWNYDWPGRYLVQQINLSCVFIQPTVSYKISNFLSVGGGFIYASGKFNLDNALPVQDMNTTGTSRYADGEAHLHGTGNGVGFNLGIQMKASEKLQFGITYRSQVNMDLNGGTATFTVPASLATAFPNTRFSSSLPLPQVASIGIGYKPLNNEKLTLVLDLNYTGWNSFDSLRFNFDTHTSSLTDMHLPRHYRNTLTTRLGGNYKISKTVSVMAGASYDPTPVVNGFVSPDLPDADRINLSCGASVKPCKRVTIIAACEFTTTAKHASTYDYGNFNGTYTTQAITPGIGAYYNF